ncbi:unnamed protein product [Hymenolepis diminuta]|uniref:Homeobox domain-containing protein n=2 Tax=Hymenolepis diminuta TaxID=6216 RepID=A0A564YAC9_HYMDI|nr:unnamed protein product [Hymenolepis diminuta]
MSVGVGCYSHNIADKVTAYHPTRASIPTSAEAAAANRHGVGNSLPLCTQCRLPVEDKYMVRVRGRSLHANCAVCSICNCSLNEFCFIMEGRLICRQDYIRLYAVKCAACKMPMLMHELCMRTSPNEVYHVNCFRCSMCGEQLPVGAEYARDPSTNAPICRKNCVPRSSSSSMAGNGGGTTSESVTPSAAHLPHQIYNSGKRGRTTLSAKQRARLEQVFETNPRPNTKVREALAVELGLPVRVVQVWFQNQRAREKALSAKSVSSASPAVALTNVNNATVSIPTNINSMSAINAVATPSLPTSSFGSPVIVRPSQYRPGMKKTQLHQWLDLNTLSEDLFQD